MHKLIWLDVYKPITDILLCKSKYHSRWFLIRNVVKIRQKVKNVSSDYLLSFSLWVVSHVLCLYPLTQFLDLRLEDKADLKVVGLNIFGPFCLTPCLIKKRILVDSGEICEDRGGVLLRGNNRRRQRWGCLHFYQLLFSLIWILASFLVRNMRKGQSSEASLGWAWVRKSLWQSCAADFLSGTDFVIETDGH